MKDRSLFVFWRRVYELPSALFWFLGAIVTALWGYYGDFGFRFLLLASIPMGIIGLYRLLQANRLLSLKARMQSMKDMSMSLDDLISICKKNPDKAYIGEGFDWTQKHTQMVYDIHSREQDNFHPGAWYMFLRKILGLTSKYNPNVRTYLHAIGEDSQPKYLNLMERYTHRALGGTTGSGKGRALTLDLVGAIVRHESGIFVDPKTDEIAVDVSYAAMKKMGREQYFYYFNPAYPQSSVRLDLLASYGTLGQIASKVVNIMPPSKDESFKQFSWRAINCIVHVLSLMGEKITLVKIRECIQQDVSKLVHDAGVYYLSQFPETLDLANRQKLETNSGKAAGLLQAAYYAELADTHPSNELEALFGIYSQDQKHYQKLIQNIIPQLTQLTQGPLRALLSPDPNDGDPRPIVSLKTIIRTRGLLYMNLASLADPVVGSSLGALLINDAISTVSDRYFYRHEKLDDVPMNLWIDEASDVLNAGALSLASKSRGASVALTFAYQTINDLILRLGSKEAAEVALGNLNIKSQYRSEDEQTQQYISGQMKETTVRYMDYNLITNSVDGRVADFNTSYSKQLKHVDYPVVSPGSLGDLPNLNMFTMHESGRIVKLRVPYITVKEHFVKPTYGPRQFGKLPAFESLTGIDTGSFQFSGEET